MTKMNRTVEQKVSNTAILSVIVIFYSFFNVSLRFFLSPAALSVLEAENFEYFFPRRCAWASVLLISRLSWLCLVPINPVFWVGTAIYDV